MEIVKKAEKTKDNRRHHDDEIVDHVEIECVPRYKESHLSGDEWRVGYRVKLRRKGTVLYSRSYGRMSDAAAHLPWLLRVFLEELPDEHEEKWLQRIKDDRTTCAQVGCAEPATVFYMFNRLYAKNGEGPLPGNSWADSVTQFCDRHKTRGDCGLEDADRNYETL